MKTNKKKNTGMRIPPPFFYLAALGVGLVFQHIYPSDFEMGIWGNILGGALVGLGVGITTTAIRLFRKAKTPFDVRKNATTLVTSGPYKWTRNPGYLSITLIYGGIGCIFSNVWILFLTIPIVLTMDLWIIRKEERNLEELFGEEYLAYKAKVRRWL